MLNGPGTILQQTRNKLGYTIDDVHSATKIKKEYIEGLENDDISAFPAELYYKNFLKSYAVYLELNPNELIQIYEQAKIEYQKSLVEQDNNRESKFACFYKNNKKLLMYIIGFCVVIICLIIIINLVNMANVINKKTQEEKINSDNIVISTSSAKVVSNSTEVKQQEKIKQKSNKANTANITNKTIQEQKTDKNNNVISALPKVVPSPKENTANVTSKTIQEQKTDKNNNVISTLPKDVPGSKEEIKKQPEQKNTADILNKNTQEHKTDKNNMVVSTLTKVVSNQTEATQHPEQIKQKLYIKALADTWIKVTADSKDVFEGTVTNSLESKANDEFVVKIGNVDTVEVYFNGKLVDVTAGKVSLGRVKTITLKRSQN